MKSVRFTALALSGGLTLVSAALALSGGLALVSVAAAGEVLPWVEDYTRALAQARAKNVPVFVEAWAPW